ncbi:MAG: hypothetical protein GKR89_37885 [Candidatus Latescibacteria bacterium]|nr:hypothetical protein [Candidatus Latescibacterota bacterium]
MSEKEISAPTGLAYSTPEKLLQDFASRGLVVLAPESLGIAPQVHQRIYAQEKQAADTGQSVTPSSIPEVLEILNAPGLVAACNQLVGKNWAIVPFTHNATFASGSHDQAWHKDDNAPYNSRKQRHHQAVQIEMLYYPQSVAPDMGPTATAPYTHYWAFNHEENHDNFAGADHLDFNYQLSGMDGQPVSGPDSQYESDDIVHRRTAHDIRMREAITNLKWPLAQQFEAAPLKAGSVVLYSHNTFHRGNHRRDDWQTWKDNPRFMWRFWIYRTTDVNQQSTDRLGEVDWQGLGVDPLTGSDLATANDDLTALWRYHYHWMHTGQTPPPRPEATALSNVERQQEADRLFAQLHAKDDPGEPVRIGAAYQLAAIGDTGLALRHLGQALYSDRESVRRAATYGLVAVGPEATETFLKAAQSPIKWVRKAGVYGLGDASPLTNEVMQVVVARLREDPSVYVRSVAAGTLGCLGRRAVATAVGAELIPACVEALVESLRREENRLAMDRAQGRSIKFVRPTDECDVCEGNGIDFGLKRFKPVRSAVRENALWSLVILSSHGGAVLGSALEPTIATLRQVVGTDKNVIDVGFAMDALTRLAHLGPQDETVGDLRTHLLTDLGQSPVRSWEALVRGGLSQNALAQFKLAKPA